MKVKDLIATLATMPADAEVFADDWNKRHVIRDIHLDHQRGQKNATPRVTLRLWLTDEELFEEERKNTEWLLKANKKRR